ncbi:hypothetical protein BEWA_043380 [Theileria equi strain WA]|uniref:Uncharacterized protein n=1 Tax=Theileria equi strain WA TaxID=1537102 RepID=L1LFV6_THEEQ|nr:hypothetical protein BEWA_043380 [Theileria equi strain WA]EKX74297.1 hypothetical protein BEWA_043380 [Theileria equi strain WA]|eukprot:XP_004833749.1 hypothetical protein BEWA_043380 [Theileria equi strain WA]
MFVPVKSDEEISKAEYLGYFRTRMDRNIRTKIVFKLYVLASIIIRSVKLLFSIFMISKYRLYNTKYGFTFNRALYITRHNNIIEDVLLEITNSIECDEILSSMVLILFSHGNRGITRISDLIVGEKGGLTKGLKCHTCIPENSILSNYHISEQLVLQKIKKTVTFDDNIEIHFISARSYGSFGCNYIESSIDFNPKFTIPSHN